MNYQLTTLKHNPELYNETIDLIENSFHYQKPHSFETDFYSLMSKKNHENNYILTNNNEVIAHIGVLRKKIRFNNYIFPITMLGGIAVKDSYRGQGIFSILMKQVLSQSDECLFYLLWSDLGDVYSKFNFHLAGSQFQLHKHNESHHFIQTKYHQLADEEKIQIQELYKNSFSKKQFTIMRTQHEWNDIEKITSADLYIKKEQDQITAYCFKNKGQDLNDIIFEYGYQDQIDYQELTNLGHVWTTQNTNNLPCEQHFFGYLRLNNLEMLQNFTQVLTECRIMVTSLSNETITIQFKDENFQLSHIEFLTGILGPNKFGELKDLENTLFISGLDSI
jgi:predicted GNAT family N-acyltransferase